MAESFDHPIRGMSLCPVSGLLAWKVRMKVQTLKVPVAIKVLLKAILNYLLIFPFKKYVVLSFSGSSH